MAGRLRRPIIIIFFLLSVALEKGTLGAHKKTVGHYLCNLHGGYAPGEHKTYDILSMNFELLVPKRG